MINNDTLARLLVLLVAKRSYMQPTRTQDSWGYT